MTDETQVADVGKGTEKKRGLALFLVLGLTLLTVAFFFYASGRLMEGERSGTAIKAANLSAPPHQKDNQSGQGSATGSNADNDRKGGYTGNSSAPGQTPSPQSAAGNDATAPARDAKQPEKQDQPAAAAEEEEGGRITVNIDVPAMDVERDGSGSPGAVDVSASVRRIMRSRIRLMGALEGQR